MVLGGLGEVFLVSVDVFCGLPILLLIYDRCRFLLVERPCVCLTFVLMVFGGWRALSFFFVL